MLQSFTGRKRIRKSFGRIPEVAPLPNLIEVQMSAEGATFSRDEMGQLLDLSEAGCAGLVAAQKAALGIA